MYVYMYYFTLHFTTYVCMYYVLHVVHDMYVCMKNVNEE